MAWKKVQIAFREVNDKIKRLVMKKFLNIHKCEVFTGKTDVKKDQMPNVKCKGRFSLNIVQNSFIIHSRGADRNTASLQPYAQFLFFLP